MSTTLPIVEPSVDLVDELLAAQQSLTAVERFCAVKEADALLDGTEPAQAHYYKELLPATPPGPGQQFSFEVDLDKCSGCKACVVACHTMNGLEEDESWRRVGTLTIGEPIAIDQIATPLPIAPAPVAEDSVLPRIQHVTTACHHCEDPGCLNGCPVKAYDKDPVTGIVRHLDDQCIGCKYCMMMCPYEVPQYSERLGIVRKCDMCHQRLSAGEAPACVQACPNEAIAIRTVDVGQQPESTSSLAAGAPPSSITVPTTVYKSSLINSQTSAVPQDKGVDPIAESHWPLAIMLVATEISVGIVLLERLAALLGLVIGKSLPIGATQWSATAALVIAGIGMGIAPLHLGQPLRAWRVFLGLRTSWLSREAVLLGKYMGLLSAAVGLLWLPVYASWLPEFATDLIPGWAAKATLGMSLLFGIAGLISSAMIYVATKRQLWRISRTFARFIGTAFVGGAVWLVPTLIGSRSPTAVGVVVVLAAIAFVVGKLAWEWRVYLSPTMDTETDSTLDDYDARSHRLSHGPLKKITSSRGPLAVAGLILMAVAVGLAAVSTVMATGVAVLAAVVICVGELVERLVYFQSVVYDRMPGTLE